MATNSARLLNLGLRSATLGTRFLFIFFLAKYLDPASVGYYGIFTATLGYAIYFVGLDFYTYVSREIVKAPADQRGKLLKGHAALSGLLYLALLPLGIWLLTQSGWPGLLSTGLTPVQACMRYANSLDVIDRVVVGVDSDAQLQEIIEAADGKLPTMPEFPDLQDARLINPASWNQL